MWTDSTMLWYQFLLFFAGSKKSVAMKCITNGLKALQAAVWSDDPDCSILDTAPLFCSNETITTSKLSDQLVKNDGVYLNIIDEIEGLFEALEGKTRETIDRRMWLSLNTGAAWSRSTIQSTRSVEATRMNYTGGMFLYV